MWFTLRNKLIDNRFYENGEHIESKAIDNQPDLAFYRNGRPYRALSSNWEKYIEMESDYDSEDQPESESSSDESTICLK